MDDASLSRKLTTIVALDVAGYSARMEADEARTAAEVAALRDVVNGIAAAHGGRLFNTAGDGFMLEFGSSVAAVEAAVALADACEPKVRVGVHLGDVVVQPNGDLLGHGVNVAARLMTRSAPGSALVSADVRRTIRGPLAERLVSRGNLQLDKMTETVEVFTLGSKASVESATSHVNTEPFGPGWLEARLRECGDFEKGEVEENVRYCVRFLHRAGIFSEAAARRFLTDAWCRATVWRILREELNNPGRKLGAYAYCYWGPRLHHSAPDQRAVVIAHLRTEIRKHLDPETSQEMTRERQIAMGLVEDFAPPPSDARTSSKPVASPAPPTGFRYTRTAVSFLGFKLETESYEHYAEKVDTLRKQIEEIKERDKLILKADPTPWDEAVIFEARPQQLAAEPHLAWWHVSITSGNEAEVRCRAYLRREGCTDLPLLWATNDGPREVLGLRPSHGEYHLPILARCVVNAMISGDPRNLRHFPLLAGVTRITDASAILRQQGFVDLPPGIHYFRIVVHGEGLEPTASPECVATVPDPRGGNDGLSISAVRRRATNAATVTDRSQLRAHHQALSAHLRMLTEGGSDISLAAVFRHAGREVLEVEREFPGLVPPWDSGDSKRSTTGLRAYLESVVARLAVQLEEAMVP